MVDRSSELPPEAVRYLFTAAFDALGQWDFVQVRRHVGRLGRSRRDLQPSRRLAQAGQLLIDLDLEDLDHPPAVETTLRTRLQRVCLPQTPSPEPRGLYGSLLPTMDLVLDVIALRFEQDDVDSLLTAVHLLSEALPLLAWESVLGHAGDPMQLLSLTTQRGSLWATDECPTTGPMKRAARGLRMASLTDESWREYSERSWSLLGGQLAECVTCDRACTFADLAKIEGAGLKVRMGLADAFQRSDLLGHRHGSTVGHAFAVPSIAEVEQAWLVSRGRLRPRAPQLDWEDEHPLTGLRALVEAVAGAPLQRNNLLMDVREALRAELKQLEGMVVDP